MMCSVFENVENHAYSQKPFGMKSQVPRKSWNYFQVWRQKLPKRPFFPPNHPITQVPDKTRIQLQNEETTEIAGHN